MTGLTLITEILRTPVDAVDRIVRDDTLATDGPRLILALVAGAAAFGAVVGGYRSVLQALFVALKMPILLLVPLLLVLPALRALWATCEVEVSYPRLAVATLVGAARTAVLAAAAGPILWLAWPLLGYHEAVVVFAGSLALLGLPGLLVIARAVPAGGQHRWVAVGGSLALLGLVTMQSGWMLRPFVARPTTEISLVRAMEDDVFEALATTLQSARGIYRPDADGISR